MKRLLIILTLFAPLTACGKGETTVNVVPMPREVTMQKGSFNVKGAGINYDSSLQERTITAIGKFADDLSVGSGKTASLASTNGLTHAAQLSSLKGIFFLADPSMEAENYRIEIGKKALKVTAADHNGFFYAIQTLRQMLPVANYAGKPAPSSAWKLPCSTISDGPQYSYRGIHLDCCRHFFSVDEVKKFIRLLSMYKINRFHWHLTEDQGWRIEIKRYPGLTEVGAFRNGTMIGKDFNSNDGVRYGGYYTQEQIRDIVACADELGITVIPEIDLPGHMLSALATYPELGCTGGPYEVWSTWGVAEDVLCVGKEETFEFLQNVLDEVCELFPSEYIHIGGDECPKTRWESCPLCQARIRQLGLKSDGHATKEQRLQNYVTARIQKYLEGKGRKIIGWDEILEGDLDKGATIMSWRGKDGGIAGAKKGFDVIMSPNDYCYLDYYQVPKSLQDKEPLAIGGEVTLDRTYSLDPVAGLTPEQAGHIVGPQANLWTEYIATPEYLEYMLLPRMLALAEVGWCKPENKDFDRFVNDVHGHQYAIFDLLGYNYHK